MKHSIKLICGALALLLVLSGCQGDVAPDRQTGEGSALDPQNPETVVLWHYYVGDSKISLENMVDEFNQTVGMERGVIVSAVGKGSIQELEEDVTNSAMGVINSEPMPEIFSSYPDKALEIDRLGKVCDLNAYFTEEEKALFVEDFLQNGIFDEGRFLVVPIVKSTEQLYLNATTWETFKGETSYTESDLTTWEGLYDVAKAYYEWTDAQTPEIMWNGTGFFGLDSLPNYVVLGSKQLGLEVVDAEKEQALLDSGALRTVFDCYFKGMTLGYFDAVGSFRSDDIKAGDLVAYVGSTSSAGYFPTWIEVDGTQEPIDFLALPFPHFAQGEPWAVQQGAGMCVSISTEAKQEGAALFLKWFTEKEQNVPFAMNTGYLPVQRAAMESSAFDHVLQELYAGDKGQQNIANVYEIALYQITEANTYAVYPFEGSYDIRMLLEETLDSIVLASRKEARALQDEGYSEAEILEALDLDARYDAWIALICKELDYLDISYEIR